ncbi:MAG: carboxymuconolactone decarboxylase family protein [Dehalococcoidia bacterium]
MDINAAGGSDAGVSDDKIVALPDFRTSPHYTEAERAALELAETTVATPVEVSDELFARLRTHYDEAQLVELAATAALENFRARFNRVFRIEPNALYCPVEGHERSEVER